MVLFGSYARGEQREDSDLDLLIIVKGLPKRRLKRQEIFDEVDPGGWPLVSPILKTVEEAERMSPLYLDMVDDSMIIYDRDRFFEGVLMRLKKALNEKGARRVRLGEKMVLDLEGEVRARGGD